MSQAVADKPICPHCGKQVKHRKVCPVERKRLEEEAKLRRERERQERLEYEARQAELERQREERWDREREQLEQQFPELVNYLEILETKLRDLKDDLENRYEELAWKDTSCSCNCCMQSRGSFGF